MARDEAAGLLTQADTLTRQFMTGLCHGMQDIQVQNKWHLQICACTLMAARGLPCAVPACSRGETMRVPPIVLL